MDDDDSNLGESVPKSKTKSVRLLPAKEPAKVKEWNEGSKKSQKSAKNSGIGPMCIFIKEHGQKLCQRLEKLHRKQNNGLLDLEIVCEGKKLQAHKIVMAASSRFFCSRLCKSNILVPVIIKLEDFDLKLTYEAVKHLVEFVYCGKVTIPGEDLKQVCTAAHALGIYGLVDFLPSTSVPNLSFADDDDLISLSSDEESDDQTISEDSSPNREESSPAKRRPNVTTENHSKVLPPSKEPSQPSTTSDRQSDSAASLNEMSGLVSHVTAAEQSDEQIRHENVDQINNEVTNQNVQIAISNSTQMPLDSISTSFVYQSVPSGHPHQHQQQQQHQHQNQQQHQMLNQPQYTTTGQYHFDVHSQLMTDSLVSDEVQILGTSNGPSGHTLYYASPQMSFKSFPDQKIPDANSSTSQCSNQINASSSTSQQHQISRGKLRIINQEGIITNTAENIQTPSIRDISSQRQSAINYPAAKMTNCKILPGEQIYDVESVLEDQLFHIQPPQPIVSLADQDASSYSVQMTTSQNSFLPVLPHSFVTWNPMNSSNSSNVLHITEESHHHHNKEKSNQELDLTDLVVSNQWPIGGAGVPRSQHHGPETISNITEGSWTVPAEATWIPDESVAREDGDSRTSSVSVETSLNFGPGSTWHSSVDNLIISSDKNQHSKVFYIHEDNSEILELEEIGTNPDENESRSEAISQSAIPPPPLIDSRPTEDLSQTLKKRKKSSNPGTQNPGLKDKKKRDLEVRKDLTLPTAPTAGVDNVFQPDDTRLSDPETHLPNPSGSSSTKDCSEQLKCQECQMSFSNNAQLKSHRRFAHHQPEILSCPVCKETGFKEKEGLKMHLYKTHGMGEFFRCEECNYETSIKVSYIRHVSGHASTQMNCTKCNKTFKSKSGLKLHLKQHLEEDLHKCEFCDFKTPQRVNYLNHLATKHKKSEAGEELKMSIQCTMCTFKCVAGHQLKAHILRKHTSKEDMKFQCTSCDYASVERAALDKHIRFKHTNERPFLCQICGFSTHTISAMSRHKRGHSKTKPHVCGTCGTAYADRKRLKDHLLGHSGKLPFSCDFCGFSSRRKDNLQAHIRRVHPELSHSKLSPAKSQSQVALPSTFHPDPDVDSMEETPVRELEEVEAKFFCEAGPSDDESQEHEDLLASSGKVTPIDRSYIVGHINRDGSIRPVVPATGAHPESENSEGAKPEVVEK